MQGIIKIISNAVLIYCIIWLAVIQYIDKYMKGKLYLIYRNPILNK